MDQRFMGVRMITAAQRDQLDQEGFFIVRDALTPSELEQARTAVDRAAEFMKQRYGTTHIAGLDPNAANIRLNHLPAADPHFIEMLQREDATSAVRAVIGDQYVVSNFSGNIAMPGAGSMNLHSDQALVSPAPWPDPLTVNVIWCLDDVTDANGATRYLPGSHRFRSFDDVPADAISNTVAFEAPAGSMIVMEGRLWHTSGRNVTTDQRRRMIFAYYARGFLRQQINWALVLPGEVQAALDAPTRGLFGLTEFADTGLGGILFTQQ
jgi:ectoine hydroxylase-related dioxygenase (phytanoyl-CoA dioxygenase family)